MRRRRLAVLAIVLAAPVPPAWSRPTAAGTLAQIDLGTRTMDGKAVHLTLDAWRDTATGRLGFAFEVAAGGLTEGPGGVIDIDGLVVRAFSGNDYLRWRFHRADDLWRMVAGRVGADRATIEQALAHGAPTDEPTWLAQARSAPSTAINEYDEWGRDLPGFAARRPLVAWLGPRPLGLVFVRAERLVQHNPALHLLPPLPGVAPSPMVLDTVTYARSSEALARGEGLIVMVNVASAASRFGRYLLQGYGPSTARVGRWRWQFDKRAPSTQRIARVGRSVIQLSSNRPLSEERWQAIERLARPVD